MKIMMRILFKHTLSARYVPDFEIFYHKRTGINLIKGSEKGP